MDLGRTTMKAIKVLLTLHVRYYSSYAVDGIIQNTGNMYHSANDHFPWWIVDLREMRAVHQIQIFTRQDCCYDRLHSLEVRIGSTLRTDDKTKSSSKKSQQYTEGWIEFKSKRKAKWVTMMLNSNKVGGKKKDACYDELWNIKYLPRFKWAFLHQRLEYERESYRQRMNAAISQVRQETDHFVKVSETSEKKRKKEKKEQLKDKTSENAGESVDAAVPTNKVDIKSGFVFKQRNTDSEIIKKKDKKQKDAIFKKRIAERKKLKEKRKLKKLKNKKPDEDFLGSVFVGSSQ
ncbi:uncharacterized protein [Macrobrachium rosenbergii]|uniref:uncharacterized protein isoform X2 n=1 Tax=Macrobrachium rosenbergii TaxID=79674 RepID=UPI0034D39823